MDLIRDMEERLKMVIDKIIIPQYPSITYFVVTSESIRDMKYNFVFDRPIYKNRTTYFVKYYFKNNADMQKFGMTLDEETMSLFDMLGPSEDEDITVEFGISY